MQNFSDTVLKGDCPVSSLTEHIAKQKKKKLWPSQKWVTSLQLKKKSVPINKYLTDPYENRALHEVMWNYN